MTAKWVVVSYTITYIGDKDVNHSNPTTYTIESETIILKPISKSGYIFDGWFEGTKKIENISHGSNRNIALTARWTPIQYSITYKNTKNAVNGNQNSYTIETEKVTLLPLSKDGYTFNGWMNESGEVIECVFGNEQKNIILTAKWTLLYYTADFYADGKFVGMSTFTVEDTTITNIPEPPEKTGYSVKWATYEIEAKDLTIIAVYTINRYTITWKNYDGSVLKIDTNVEFNSVPEYNGSTPQRPSDSKNQYIFTGWMPSIRKTTEDAEYIAQFSAKFSSSYLVSYDANGGYDAPSSQTKNKDSAITISTTKPTHSKYLFVGWQCPNDGKIYRSGDIFYLNENVTLYALWGHNCETCDGKGSIPYKDNCSNCGGGGRITSSTWATCSGCNGSGKLYYTSACSSCKGLGGRILCKCASGHSWWQNDGSRKCPYCSKYASSSEKITTCSTCNGSGLEKSYKTCASCGGKGGKYVNSSVNCGSCGGTGTVEKYKICNNCNGETVVKNDAQSFIVSLNDADSKIGTDTVSYGAPYKLDIPTKNGYSFDGWYDALVDGKRYTYSDGVSTGVWSISENAMLYAHWVLNYYTITYDIDEYVDLGDVPYIYTIEDEIIFLCNQSREYYTFKWTIDGKEVTVVDTSFAKDIVVKGVWTPIKYSIVYELNGGKNNSKNPSTYTIENEIVLSSPTKDGYTFIGWSNGGIIDKGSAGDKTFVASWEVTEYFIVYELSGGINAENNPTKYTIETETINLFAPTRENYTFVGWKEGSNIPRGSYGNKTFTAEWRAIDYSIVYDLNGGENDKNNPTSYTIEDEIVLSAPSKIGYVFVGWKEGSNIPRGSYGDKTFTAEWQIAEYSITYVLDGGKNIEVNPTKYTIDSETIILLNPTKQHYIFVGWIEGDSIPNGSYGDKTFTAQWKAIEYSINYESNSGTNDVRNPTSYTVEDEILLFAPIKTGYTGMWSNDGRIEKGSYGNKTFTASYAINRYNVTVVPSFSDACNIKNAGAYDYNSEVVILLSDVYIGYEFVGWHNEETLLSTDNSLALKVPANDVTIIAKLSEKNEIQIYNFISTIDSCQITGVKDKTITNAIIPNYVTSIGKSAFWGCSDLLNISIPDSVTSIGSSAFWGCSGLKNIDIPNSVTFIGSLAFSGCSGLTSITIPSRETCLWGTRTTIENQKINVGISASS